MFAMIFPGQGSINKKILKKFKKKNLIVKKIFYQASEALCYDLWKIIKKNLINKSENDWKIHPVILSISVIIWKIWKRSGGKNPSFMAGNSLGEYSALVCSGSLNFIEAIKLVAYRGKIMQEAVSFGNGAMYAVIGLNKEKVNEICKKISSDGLVSISNFNSIDQIVISGYKNSVKYAILECKKAGAKYTLPLYVNAPSHCSLMKPIAEKLAIKLEKINFISPIVPIINNVDVKIERNSIMIKKALVRQLYNPVRWQEIIKYFLSKKIKILLEIGQGNVLTKLNKYIDNKIFSIAVNSPSLVKETIRKTILRL